MTDDHRDKLYCVNCTTYVQYGGKGKVPEALKKYMESHGGQHPPYMHLPTGKVEFRLETGGIACWPGTGPLPEAVVDSVKENGFLPRYSDGAADAFDAADDDDEWGYPESKETDKWID